jgi:hypothetical protein
LAERLGEVPGARGAGDVQLALDHVEPLLGQRVQQRRVARFEIEVGGAGGEVQRPDRVALDRRRLADRHAVLERRGAVVAVRPDAAATALVQEEPREIEVAPLARLAIQLDQRGLDLRVAIGRLAPARAEHPVDVVDEPPRNPEQALVAGGAPMRDRRLDQVPGAVELVAVREISPPPAGSATIGTG